ncbi:hypothetical protein HY642_00390 [Candidatus Woesearchaeota archaeon]|nr:hypothetical protein [Candidatus Woesearchaeota archaeon]
MALTHRYTDYGADFFNLANYAVTYKDVFSMSYFYLLMHEWLVDEGYATRSDEKFPETFYLQRENPQFGKELWIRWRLQKNPMGSKLWRYDLDIDMHILGLKEVEVVSKGQKLKMDKGEVEVRVAANLVYDYENGFKNHPVLKDFRKAIFVWLLKKQFGQHKRGLISEAYRFQEALKTYLKLETYLPEREFAEFWAKRGES